MFAFVSSLFFACAPVLPPVSPDPRVAAAEAVLPADHPDVVATRVWVDTLDQPHVRFRQELDGVPVHGGEAIVHLDGGSRLASVTDALLDDVQVDAVPTLSSTEAVELGAPPGAPARAELEVLRLDAVDHLAWRVRSRVGGPSPARPVVYVDAHDGTVLRAWDDLETVSAAVGTGTAEYAGSVSVNTTKSGSRYYLEDATRRAGTYTYGGTTSSLAYLSDGDDKWTSDPVAVQAHHDAATVLDYYADRFGRDGIDGAGGPGEISALDGGSDLVASFVHYDVDYANAFWDGGAMTYGDGDGVTFDPLVSLDIAGHELTHGVTQFTAGLEYSGESGALNESMSDVFGAMVEAWDDGAVSADTWAVGEDVYTPGTAGDALRRLDDPASDGVSYDYYDTTVASADVHEGSGIGNLAFYLVAEGGAHPTRGGTAVTGVGTDAAEQIWYRALTTYLTSTSDYAAARTATASAAADLYGAASAEADAVDAAWATVGVGGGTCTGYGHSDAGTLVGTSAYAIVPSTGSFVLSAGGKQSAALSGPSGANFDLYLQKYSSGSWRTVKSSAGSTSTESFTYSGRSGGTFRYKVKSSSGAGDWTLCYDTP